MTSWGSLALGLVVILEELATGVLGAVCTGCNVCWVVVVTVVV